MSTEHSGQWRIFTQRDFNKTLRNLKRSEFVSLGFWSVEGNNLNQEQPVNHIHASQEVFDNAIKRLRSQIQKQNFEHGQEGKLSRAHIYRPYRLVLDGQLVAVIMFRASEAYNLCEIDVFLTTESQGLYWLEATRAALIFAFSDATKNAGSMAVQFTKACAPDGIPPHVLVLAKEVGVQLMQAKQGVLSPNEVRELFLRLSGLSELAQARVRDFAQKRFFSIERICYLVVQGLWPAREAEIVLLSAPFPDLILGVGVDASVRHLAAHAMAHARTAVLSGILDRALRYVQPHSSQKTFIENKRYFQISSDFEPDQLSITHGPLPDNIQLLVWSADNEQPPIFSEDTTLIAFLRPRSREEIRVFLKHDIEQAKLAKIRNAKTLILLVCSNDFLQLSIDERIEAHQMARKVGVNIIVCPETIAALEVEVYRRQRVGRTVRQ